MATLCKITSSGRRTIHQGFLSGQKRSLPTTIQSSPQNIVSAEYSRPISSNVYSNVKLTNAQRTYIPNRNFHRNNLARDTTFPSHSTRHFSSFMDKFKKQAEEAAKSVAKEASKRAKETAQVATKKAQKAVSETIESTQIAAKHATDKAIRTASQKASEAAQGVTKATKEKLKSTVTGAKQQISNSAPAQSISRSTQAISSGIEQTTKVASQSAETIKESSKTIKENFTSTSTKAIRWFWWWSLAAIFVYGVASTLPMAIIKYTIEQKKKAFQERTKETEPQEQVPSDAQPQP